MGSRITSEDSEGGRADHTGKGVTVLRSPQTILTVDCSDTAFLRYKTSLFRCKLRDSTTGETVSSPSVPPQRERSAAPSAHEADRELTTWAHGIDADCLREAYRRSRAVMRSRAQAASASARAGTGGWV